MNTIKLIQTELIKKSPERKQTSFKSTIRKVLRAACTIHVLAWCAYCEQRDKYDHDPHDTVFRQLHTGVDRTITV